MRAEDDVVQRQQWIARLDRFRLRDIQGGIADNAIAKCLVQCPRIDDRAAGRIDQHRSRLHLGQSLGIDEMGGCLGQRGMNRHKIRLPQQGFQADTSRPHLGRVGIISTFGIIVQHPHLKTLGPLGHSLADTAKADDAQRGPADIIAQQQCRPPGLPFTGPGEFVSLNHAPGGSHQQGKGKIGGRIGENAGGVAHWDAPSSCLRHHHIVKANGIVADNL